MRHTTIRTRSRCRVDPCRSGPAGPPFAFVRLHVGCRCCWRCVSWNQSPRCRRGVRFGVLRFTALYRKPFTTARALTRVTGRGYRSGLCCTRSWLTLVRSLRDYSLSVYPHIPHAYSIRLPVRWFPRVPATTWDIMFDIIASHITQKTHMGTFIHT